MCNLQASSLASKTLAEVLKEIFNNKCLDEYE